MRPFSGRDTGYGTATGAGAAGGAGGRRFTDANDPSARSPEIEALNSPRTRHVDDNASNVFSAFVFVLAFLVATALGFLIAGDMNIWVLCIGFAVAVIAIFTVRIAAQWERIIILRFGSFNRVAGRACISPSRSSSTSPCAPTSASCSPASTPRKRSRATSCP